MARNFVVSAALTFGMLVVGVNVSALEVGAPTVTVAERTSLDQERAATARASKRAELRAALDSGHMQTSPQGAGPTEVVLASPRRNAALP